MLEPAQIEELLWQPLKALEEERISLHQITSKEKLWRKILLGLLLVLGLYGLTFFEGNAFLGALAAYFTLAYFVIHESRKKLQERQNTWEKKFEQKIKQEIYQTVFKAWNSTVLYKPEDYIKKEDFEKARLYFGATSYEGEDYCEGVLKDGRAFQFSEIDSHKTVKEADDYGVRIHEIPIFKGLFFILENTLPYPDFRGRAAITPHSIEEDVKEKIKKQASINKERASASGQDILDADFSDHIPPRKDSPQASPSLFDKIYTVQEEEHIPSTSIREQLPQELTQQLGYFKSFYGQHFSICFDDNKAYFASQHPWDFLQVPIEDSLISEARIKHLTKDFQLVFMLLEKIADVTTLASSQNQ